MFDKMKDGSIGYDDDGLVLTPVNEGIRMGTHETMFKWKPREKNTVDFLAQVRANGDVALYVQDRGELFFFFFYNPKKNKVKMDVKNGDILECQYQDQSWPRWWKPVGKRTDKNHPNNRRTYNRTMVNIEQDIQMDEFLKIQK